MTTLSCHEVDGVRKEKERKEKRIENRDFIQIMVSQKEKEEESRRC